MTGVYCQSGRFIGGTYVPNRTVVIAIGNHLLCFPLSIAAGIAIRKVRIINNLLIGTPPLKISGEVF
jgi:hypothetical protein